MRFCITNKWFFLSFLKAAVRFKSHSVRSAAVSKASAKFVSVDKVLKVAGWSNAKTFAMFYKKNL
jgi:hypothetical protein